MLQTSTPSPEPALYLFPSTMSDGPVSSVLPPDNLRLMEGIKHYVVENVRTQDASSKRHVRPSTSIR